MVIWVTGLSGAGKTTLCDALAGLLRPRFPNLVVLDGDVVRDCISGDLGFGAADRKIQVGRIQRLARALAAQGMIVLVAALYADDELLAWNRANLPGYVEVYLEAEVDFLATRDGKGLYAGARSGRIADVVGVSVAWHAPKAADLTFRSEDCCAPEDLARRVIAAVPGLSAAGFSA